MLPRADARSRVIPILLVLPCVGYISETSAILSAVSELDMECICK